MTCMYVSILMVLLINNIILFTVKLANNNIQSFLILLNCYEFLLNYEFFSF